MKKIISLTLLSSLCVLTLGPALTVAGTGSVNTNLTKYVSGGQVPIVKVKWEANADRYTDDSTAPGAQFSPSGIYQQNKTIALCAIVTDPDGLADIDNVYADVFYPEDIALGDHHVALPDQSGLGCGALMQEDTLIRLPKQEGFDLFCTDVRNNNYNLPTFNDSPMQYTYDEICAPDGELMKETAAVYCATKELSYEDPSGDYKVWAVAQDKNGQQGTLENYFEYLPTVAFEADFNAVNYGKVRLNTHKIISGDLTWNDTIGANPATVRNVGNTRLQMGVEQDDMGLGMTDGIYNVKYDARVGSTASFANYNPYANVKWLQDELDLSELDEMDFSILITKFPPTGGESFTGTMTLSAKKVNHLPCPPPCDK